VEHRIRIRNPEPLNLPNKSNLLTCLRFLSNAGDLPIMEEMAELRSWKQAKYRYKLSHSAEKWLKFLLHTELYGNSGNWLAFLPSQSGQSAGKCLAIMLGPSAEKMTIIIAAGNLPYFLFLLFLLILIILKANDGHFEYRYQSRYLFCKKMTAIFASSFCRKINGIFAKSICRNMNDIFAVVILQESYQ
jgi:hypothetical protein